MNIDRITFDRRRLLVGGVSIFGGLYLTAGRARAGASGLGAFVNGESAAPRTLLLLELNGGNDGLSTVVPYADDVYHRSRTRVGVAAGDVLKLDDYHGFHPNLKGLHRVFDEGKLAIVEGTGYPHSNHSHFTSLDIWHTARETGRASGDGWIGRLLEAQYANETEIPHAVHVGQSMPYALSSSTHPVVCFDSPTAYRWAEDSKTIATTGGRKDDAADKSPLARIRSIVRNAETSSNDIRRACARYTPRVEYPSDDLGQDLKTAAALLQSDIGCRVLSVTHHGYDTHTDQKRRHDQLMTELDGGLGAFLADVRGTPAGDQVLVLVFSEFGRRVEDNASIGTDHGTAGPMFLAGTPVKGGLYGKHPSLQELSDGDLIHTTDFRTVYATVIKTWFGIEPERILGASYTTLPAVS